MSTWISLEPSFKRFDREHLTFLYADDSKVTVKAIAELGETVRKLNEFLTDMEYQAVSFEHRKFEGGVEVALLAMHPDFYILRSEIEHLADLTYPWRPHITAEWGRVPRTVGTYVKFKRAELIIK